MAQLDRPAVARTILRAPLTTVLALTTRDDRLRERAADRLAALILGDGVVVDPDQLRLPL